MKQQPVISGGYEACTVGELIAHLQKFDSGLPCIYSRYSDVSPLQISEVELVTKEEKTISVLRGELRRWHGHGQCTEDEQGEDYGEFISAIWFPGN